MPKFSVGDRVRVINEMFRVCGDVGEIVEQVTPNGYVVRMLNGAMSRVEIRFFTSEIEVVDDAEV